jgi:ribose 1,5-bisphosphate isomerase
MPQMPLCLVFVRCSGLLSVFAVPATTPGEGIDPATKARTSLEKQTALERDDVSLTRTGDPVECSPSALADTPVQFSAGTDRSAEKSVQVYPVLFDCRSVPEVDTPQRGLDWHAPLDVLEYDTDSPLWQAYDTVRPTVARIATDSEHGSAALSVRALEVLRDEAMLAAVDPDGQSGVDATVQSLITARPTMTVLANRLARAVVSAESGDPREVAQSAQDGIGRAHLADDEAAKNASERLDGKRVATLSRSGTVSRAIHVGNPAAVLVAQSVPGGEGVGVATEFASMAETTVTSDAAFPGQLRDWGADVLLVGADSLLSDGRVVNKVGTYPAVVAADRLDVDAVVVTATDKISPGASFDAEHQPGQSLGIGEQSLDVLNPLFEATPLSSVDAVVTEDGTLTTGQIRAIASEHEARRDAL